MYSLASCQKVHRLQKRREAQAQWQSSQLRTAPHCWTRRRLGLVVFFQFSGRGQRIQQQDLEGRLCGLHAPWQNQSRHEEWPDGGSAGRRRLRHPGQDAERQGHGRRTASRRSTRGDTLEHLRGWPRRFDAEWCAEQMAHKPHGSSAQETAGPVDCDARRVLLRVTRVRSNSAIAASRHTHQQTSTGLFITQRGSKHIGRQTQWQTPTCAFGR